MLLARAGGALAETITIGSLVVYLDGNGVGSGQQVIRPIVMEDGNPGSLAAGNEVVVTDGQPPGWVHLPFDSPPTLRAGSLPRAGTWAGPAAYTVRVFGDTTADSDDMHNYSSPYYSPPVAGSIVGFVGFLPSIVLVGVATWRPQGPVTDDELAALPVDVAQGLLLGGSVASFEAAACGWHYSPDKPPPPASAIVRTDGQLADLVGERVRLTADTPTGPASVVVVVVDEQPFDETLDEDISLAREAFLRLGSLWHDSLTVRVEVLG